MDSLGEESTALAPIPNVDSLADYLDRLIVEVNKLAWFENKKRELQGKLGDFPTFEELEAIVNLDNRSRDCCELRSMLKNRINELFTRIVAGVPYQIVREARTFRPPARSLADVMADRCHDIGNLFLRGEMAEALEKELLGE